MIDIRYQAKIRTVAELVELLGPRPRRKKVIMCHGVFDVVHPGHIRHLMYARSKADVLVASLTCDAYIQKAHFRPFVPENLRALNLAALEMVDYVVVDTNPTPLTNLAELQPDFFAKGYEYVAGGMPPRTLEEAEVVEGYGGEILFTPGDVVYSSSALIESAPPDLSCDKLAALLDAEGLSFDDLRTAVGAFGGVRVHVVGDTIVDSLTHAALIGGQVKTPTLSVRQLGEKNFVGGAGIVAKHLRAAGAVVTLSTVLGDDPLKEFVLEDLASVGIDVRATVDPTRPTTRKNAIVCDGHRLLKLDTVDNRTVSDRILSRLIESVADSEADCVVFSDFRHGIFNRSTIPELKAAIPARAFRVADSQVASRWGNILEFQGFDLITPNEREARFALGDQDSVVRPLALKLYREANCRSLILKLGDRGLLSYRRREHVEQDVRAFFAIDSFAESVRDAVGAGDALLAYASLAHVTRGDAVVAAALGAMAAAVECERDGNIAVSAEEVVARVERVERRAHYA